jgi:hypothetical protein
MKAEQKINALEEQVVRLQKQLVVRFLHLNNYTPIFNFIIFEGNFIAAMLFTGG